MQCFANSVCFYLQSLSLVDTNLPAEAERDLFSFIVKHLSKGTFFEGMGNVASIDLRYVFASLHIFAAFAQNFVFCISR